MNEKTKLPSTPRRVGWAEASESLRPPTGGVEDFYPEGAGLRAALFRRVDQARVAMVAAWPLGTEDEAENFRIYHARARRWGRLRAKLVAHIGGRAVAEGRGVVQPSAVSEETLAEGRAA